MCAARRLAPTSTKLPLAPFFNRGLMRIAERRRSDGARAMADKDTKPGRGTRRRKRRRRTSATTPLAPTAPASSRRRHAWRTWLLAATVVMVCAPVVWLFVVYPSERGPGEGRAAEVVVSHNPSPTDLAV